MALSADATPQTREACRAVGFSAYLTKPVDTELLLRTMVELTGSAAAAQPRTVDRRQPRWRREPPPTEPTRAGRAITAQLASLAAARHRRRLHRRADRRLPGRPRGDHAASSRRRPAAATPAIFRDQAHALRSSAAHVGALAPVRLLPGLARARRPRPAACAPAWSSRRLRAEADRVGTALLGFKDAVAEPRMARAAAAAEPREAIVSAAPGAAPGGGPGSPCAAARPRRARAPARPRGR